MSKWSLPESDEALPLWHVIYVGILAHWLATLVFVTTFMLCLFCRHLSLKGLAVFSDSTWWDIIKNICVSSGTAVILSIGCAIIISPSLLVTLPITLFAAAMLKTGVLPTTALGAPVGVLVGLWLAWLSGGVEDGSMWIVSSATAGAAFAWIVWQTCIRPFQEGARRNAARADRGLPLGKSLDA